MYMYTAQEDSTYIYMHIYSTLIPLHACVQQGNDMHACVQQGNDMHACYTCIHLMYVHVGIYKYDCTQEGIVCEDGLTRDRSVGATWCPLAMC